MSRLTNFHAGLEGRKAENERSKRCEDRFTVGVYARRSCAGSPYVLMTGLNFACFPGVPLSFHTSTNLELRT